MMIRNLRLRTFVLLFWTFGSVGHLAATPPDCNGGMRKVAKGETTKPESTPTRFKWLKRGLGLFGGGIVSYAAVEYLATNSDHAESEDYDRAEADRRLDVAVIGDSISTGFYLTGTTRAVWQMRTERQRNWALDTSDSPDRAHSLFERLSENGPTRLTNYARVAAYVETRFAKPVPTVQFIGKVHSMTKQVDRVLSERRLPNLMLIWIGHNNLDWKYFLKNDPTLTKEEIQAKLPNEVSVAYAKQLARLVEAARSAKRKTAIVVYGLGDFRSMMNARDQVAEFKKSNPLSYPQLEHGHDVHRSMGVDARETLIELSLGLNAELENRVKEVNAEIRALGFADKVRVEFSNAFSQSRFTELSVLHLNDGWHPSAVGHSRLAEIAEKSLLPSFRFLGIEAGRK